MKIALYAPFMASLFVAGVAFEASAIDQSISDVRARSQVAPATSQTMQAANQNEEDLNKMSPAAGGMGESGFEAQEKDENPLLKNKFQAYKR